MPVDHKNNGENAVFSDESKFNFHNADDKTVSRRKGGELHSGCVAFTVKHMPHEMGWGCTSHKELGWSKFMKTKFERSLAPIIRVVAYCIF